MIGTGRLNCPFGKQFPVTVFFAALSTSKQPGFSHFQIRWEPFSANVSLDQKKEEEFEIHYKKLKPNKKVKGGRKPVRIGEGSAWEGVCQHELV